MSFSATGGVKTVDGNYTVHKFTASGDLVCSGTIDAEYLVNGGGGPGVSGGGSAGGHRTGTKTLTGTMPVVVGAAGGASSLGDVTANGGVAGGALYQPGSDGPSGGGGGSHPFGTTSGGAATPAGQGNAGSGNGGMTTDALPAGAGGGAAAAGGVPVDALHGGVGGAGYNNDIIARGSPVGYAGGGGGANHYAGGTPGTATHGGGGGTDVGAAGAGTPNTGGGGGGAGNTGTPGAGAAGIVAVRYLTPDPYTDAILSAIADLLARTEAAPNIVFDGDSLTLGAYSTSGHDYPSVVARSLSRSCVVHAFGVGGQTLAQMEADAASQIDSLLYTAAPIKNILVCWGGANDVAVEVPATVNTRLQTYVEARVAADWEVFILPVIPNGTLSTERDTWRLQVNTNTAANWVAWGAAGFVDLCANAHFNARADASDTGYYYADTIHLVDAGYAVVAGIVTQAIEGLLNPAAVASAASADAKLDAVKLKTDTIGSLAVTVTSPVAASGTITVEQGDSYSAGRSRPIDVNVDDPTHAKGLDAANVTVYLLATQFTWTAASVTETAGGYLVRFEPTIADTAAVLRGQSYKLKACIDNVAPTDDDAETIQRGRVVLNRDIPAVTAP